MSGRFQVISSNSDSLILRRPLHGSYRTIPEGVKLSKSRDQSIRILGGNSRTVSPRRASFALLSTARWPHGGKLLRLPLADWNSVEKIASKYADAAPITVLEAREYVGNYPLFMEVARFEKIGMMEFLTEASRASSELVAKAVDPISDAGFILSADRVARSMSRATSRSELDYLGQETEKALDEEWDILEGTALAAAILALAMPISEVHLQFRVELEAVLKRESQRIVRDVRNSLRRRHPDWGLSTGMNQFDKRVATNLAESQINFVRDEYGRRAASASSRARVIVADGVAAGWNREQIVAALRRGMIATGTNKSLTYWHIVSSSFVGRARSFLNLNAMKEAGFERYLIVATIDDVTTDYCFWLDGKTLSIDRGLELFDSLEELRDPEEVKFANPWFKSGVDGQGREAIFVPTGPSTQELISSITGRDGTNRSFADAPAAQDVESLNIGPPPYHARCRTQIVPA